MKIIMVRHAENGGDPFGEPGRNAKGFISAKGLNQAARLAEAIKGRKIDVVLCSPIGRAVETAERALVGKKTKFIICDFLKEWMPSPEFRESQGTRFEEILKQNADRYAEETWKTELGEGTFDLYARICPPFMKQIASMGIRPMHGGFVPTEKAKKLNIAVFAHGGSLSTLLSFILDIRPFPIGKFAFELTGLAEIGFNEKRGVYYPFLTIPAPCSCRSAEGEVSPKVKQQKAPRKK